ncbi:MAG TPA: metallophosphoesterase [Burkholderiales bacterium]
MPAKRRISVAAAFPLIVLGYVLIQLYAVRQAYVGLGLPPHSIPILVAWVALMTFALPLVWRLEHRDWHRLATVVAWVGFGWMGWVFLYFWIALGLDVVGMAVSAAGAALHADVAGSASAVTSFPFAAAVTSAVAAYGFVDARRIRVERVRLRSAKRQPGSPPFRIALISDVHLGTIVGARRLRRIVERLHQIDADAVVSTGDLVDGLEHRLRELAPLFDALRPRAGKYAVTGNHEYYAGIDHALEFHRRAGFKVLSGTAVHVGADIAIAGVDDPTGRRSPRGAETDELEALRHVAPERFTVLLKHQPVVNDAAARRFDLQLSGHVHRGQIFPFGLLVRAAYPVSTGLTPLGERRWLYVSRGTGTWGPPIRVGAPPEIAVIEIEPEAAA